MSAFQSGFGLGMTAWNNAQSAQERQLERERQARLDARAQEVHDRNVKMWREEDQTKADIKDASATRETVAGTQTTAGDTKVFSQTPENAAAMQRLLANEAELTGAAPVQAPTTAMTGQMARGHQIGATAEGQNTGDARNQRVVDALIKNGQIERAATMESTALEQRAKRLGLNRAELEWANTQYNQRIGNYFATMKPGEAVAKIVSDTKLGGLEGWTAEATPNKDGKKTDIVATGPNGEKKTLLSFDESSKADILALRQRFAKVDDATQIGWISEQVKTEQAQANADRDYGIRLADLEIRANEAKSKQEERALRAEIAQLRASRAGGGGGGGSGAGGDGVNFDPYEGFDPKNAQAEATRMVDERLSAANTQVSATERARLISEQVFALRDSYASQNANRVLISAFVNSARNAKTPQEIEAVRQQGAARGLSPKQMAELDPRFAVAAPKPAPAPASAPMANFVGKPTATAYTPPAGSPAAKAAENRAKVQANNQAQRDASIKAARSAAAAALASGDIEAGSKVQDMPGFSLLPDAEKVAIRNLVFGR